MQKMIKYRLYFGRNVKGPGAWDVTRDEFASFLIREVDCRFTCYTVFEAMGMWKGTSEKSFVLEFLTDISPPLFTEIEPGLDEIINAYKLDFHQESVMLTKEFIEVQF